MTSLKAFKPQSLTKVKIPLHKSIPKIGSAKFTISGDVVSEDDANKEESTQDSSTLKFKSNDLQNQESSKISSLLHDSVEDTLSESVS